MMPSHRSTWIEDSRTICIPIICIRCSADQLDSDVVAALTTNIDRDHQKSLSPRHRLTLDCRITFHGSRSDDH